MVVLLFKYPAFCFSAAGIENSLEELMKEMSTVFVFALI